MTMHNPGDLLSHPHPDSVAVALDKGELESTCQQVFDAEYVATCFAVGRTLARTLVAYEVDRHAVVTWVTDDGNFGRISLDDVQGEDLLTIMAKAGLA